MPIKHITSQTKLDKLIARHEKIVIKYTARWCGPCKRIAPYFEELSNTYGETLFVEIDIDDADQSIIQTVSGMPKFVSIKNGIIMNDIVGADKDNLKQMILDL